MFKEQEGERHMSTILPNLDRRIRRQLQTHRRASEPVTVFRWTSKWEAQRHHSHDLARVSPYTWREDDAGNRTFALALDGLVMRSGVMTKDKKFYHRDPEAA